MGKVSNNPCQFQAPLSQIDYIFPNFGVGNLRAQIVSSLRSKTHLYSQPVACMRGSSLPGKAPDESNNVCKTGWLKQHWEAPLNWENWRASGGSRGWDPVLSEVSSEKYL